MKTKLLVVFFILFSGALLAQNNVCNCCTENHAGFDFWIGEWDVINKNGTKAGNSVISKVQDNCVVVESWTSATANYSGTSYNFYNTKTNQWEQLWLDNQGGSLHLKGKRVGHQMILKTDDEIGKNEKKSFQRITWTANDDGTVNQLWETVVEGEETIIAFNGLYKKVKTKD